MKVKVVKFEVYHNEDNNLKLWTEHNINLSTFLESAEINEYIIPKGIIPITFFLSKTKNYVIIRSISYELKLTPNDFSLITKQMFRSIDDIYQLLKNIFEKKSYINSGNIK